MLTVITSKSLWILRYTIFIAITVLTQNCVTEKLSQLLSKKPKKKQTMLTTGAALQLVGLVEDFLNFQDTKG